MMTSGPIPPIPMERAMMWFVTLNTAGIVLFGAHLLEEQFRVGLSAPEWWLIAPTAIAFLVGLMFTYLRHAWAVGMVLAADIFLVVAVGYFHLNPASPDFVGAIYSSYESQTTGYLAAALAVALWVVGVVALIEGAWAMTKVEAHPFREATTV